jgi:2-keto-4-pentenoate hydratase/2-oxohepta-3-ene-1,7-dioic acid hydratase in catechol pathway
MKIVSFGPRKSEQAGVLRLDGKIAPLNAILLDAGLTPLGMNEILGLLDHLQPIIERALPTAYTIAADGIRMGPPVPEPPKIIVTGANYQSHLDEVGGMLPPQPLLYLKPSNVVVGARDELVRSRLTEQLDYETELAVVIGRGGRQIAAQDVYDHIAGYMICDDVTARDLAFRDIALHPIFAQVTRAKGIPTGAPTGPWLVTKDEIPDPHALAMHCWVNGELRQSGSTSDMLFDVPTMVASFSEVLDLSPGDIIMTGTVAGSGAAMKPPQFLKAGDVVRMEIDGLGVMETPVVDEV